MAKPKSVLWKADAHTIAKHRLLREYLVAWIPIMSRWNKRLLLIDGFAGPGEYIDGEDGSPVLMLKTLLEHKDFVLARDCTYNFLFIEQDHDRFEHLLDRIARLQPLPSHVNVLPPVEGNFTDVMGTLFERIEGQSLIPTFAFIDPFGYKDTAVGLTGKILSFPKSEVLIYVPLYKIARFVDQPSQHNVLMNLYGDDRWKPAAAIPGVEARQDFLAAVFASALREHTTHVLDFEMFGRTNSSGYSLFFGTNSDDGLRAIKTAMWKVDPVHGRSFRDPKIRGQMSLTFGPDLSPLLPLLRARFGEEPFTIEEASRFVLCETRFRDDAHLKSQTLKPAENRDEIEAWRTDGAPRKRGSYPDGTVLRFKVEAAIPAQRT